jgi:hypothetical protein
MRDFGQFSDYTSPEAIAKYYAMKKTPSQQYAAWSRELYKKKLEQRAQELEKYGAPEVGFGQQYTHTFEGDAEDESGSNLDYQA